MNRDDKFGDKLFGKSITPSPSDLERARLEAIKKNMRQYALTGDYPTAPTDIQHLLDIVDEERQKRERLEAELSIAIKTKDMYLRATTDEKDLKIAALERRVKELEAGK